MKKELHPTDYRPVVFQDLSNGWSFLTKSTVKTEETVRWEDGQLYPLVKVHVSSASHPLFTGQEKLIDIEGRVDRFNARRVAAAARAEAAKRAAAKKTKRAAAKSTNKGKSTGQPAKAEEAQKIGSLKPDKR